jgi:hypothetical protein
MDDDSSKNNKHQSFNNTSNNPRPLLECLQAASTFQKRRRTKTFERVNSGLKLFIIEELNRAFFLLARCNDDQIEASPSKV